MTPRQFLLYGGIILVALGLLGMFLLGPLPTSSILGEFFWLDSTENIAHLLFGIVALAAYYFLKDAQLTRWLVIAVGMVAAITTIIGFLNVESIVPNVGITNLENPSDNILHLAVAIWALWVGFMGSKAKTAQAK